MTTPVVLLDTLTEAEFTNHVVGAAKQSGWLTYHVWLSQRSAPGFPDLVLVRPPRVIFAELKRSNGRVSPAQQLWLAELGGCPGVETHLWRPADWDAVLATLRGEGPRGKDDTHA